VAHRVISLRCGIAYIRVFLIKTISARIAK